MTGTRWLNLVVVEQRGQLFIKANFQTSTFELLYGRSYSLRNSLAIRLPVETTFQISTFIFYMVGKVSAVWTKA